MSEDTFLWDAPFRAEDFKHEFSNGQEYADIANARFQAILKERGVKVFGVGETYWGTIPDEEGPDLPDTHSATLIDIKPLKEG